MKNNDLYFNRQQYSNPRVNNNYEDQPRYTSSEMKSNLPHIPNEYDETLPNGYDKPISRAPPSYLPLNINKKNNLLPRIQNK